MTGYIAILRKDADSDYGVEFPDLPGCITAGSTLEEARKMAEEALAAHVAFLREDGDEVPAPSPLDDIASHADLKGAVPFMVELREPADKVLRINITVPSSILDLIDRAAVPTGGNRSAFMVSAAEEKARALATQRAERAKYFIPDERLALSVRAAKRESAEAVGFGADLVPKKRSAKKRVHRAGR